MSDQRKTRTLEFAPVSMETESRKARTGLLEDFQDDCQIAEYPVDHWESGGAWENENLGGPAEITFQEKAAQPEIVLNFNAVAFQQEMETARVWQAQKQERQEDRQTEQSQPKYEPTIISLLSLTSIRDDNMVAQRPEDREKELRYFETWKPVRPKPTIKKTIREQAEIDLFREVYNMALQAVNAPFASAFAIGLYIVLCVPRAIETILNALRNNKS